MSQISPLDVSQLDDESREFAEWLFAWKPEWLSYAGMEPNADTRKFDLIVSIPSPIQVERLSLKLLMAEGPTIVFGDFHSHLSLMGSDDVSAVIEFKDMVEKILSDEMLSVFDTKSHWSSLTGAHELEAQLLEELTSPKGPESLRVESFNGTVTGVVTLEMLKSGRLKEELWK